MPLSEAARTHRREQAREYARRYHATHREQERLNAIKYREEHPTRQAENQARWYKKHKERVLAEQRGRRTADKQHFFEMYGWVCVCCGESRMGFLTIEHKDGNTSSGRSTAELRRAIAEYRPDQWETRCYNCNCGRATNNGICPHKMNDSVIYGI